MTDHMRHLPSSLLYTRGESRRGPYSSREAVDWNFQLKNEEITILFAILTIPPPLVRNCYVLDVIGCQRGIDDFVFDCIVFQLCVWFCGARPMLGKDSDEKQ
jgi:hypothetical protein